MFYMPNESFLFSLLKGTKNSNEISTSENAPTSTNLSPMRIRVQAGRSGPKYEYIATNQTTWPTTATCYIQIWELDKWSVGKTTGQEYDTTAKNTSNELLIEIPGYIKKEKREYNFIAQGPVKPPAAASTQTKSIVLILDVLEKGNIVSLKMRLPVNGENETCFEIGVACETSAGQSNYKQNFRNTVHHVLAHDDCFCYLSDPSNRAPRCGTDRLHYYIEAWLQNITYAEDYYTFRYKEFSNGNFVSLKSVQSFEELLRKLKKDIDIPDNSKKKIGDIIIITHGYVRTQNNVMSNVLINLPLFDSRQTGRGFPMWKLPELIDAKDINDLAQSGSNYYNHVDGPGVTDGLVSVVTAAITKYMDASTHILLGGCNLGLNPPLLQAIRSFFGGKPVVYAFENQHFLYAWKNGGGNVIRGKELLDKNGKQKINVWSSEGISLIKHVP
jgi:hypothetical protein